MVVVLKHGVAKESRDQLISWLKNLGLNIHVSEPTRLRRISYAVFCLKKKT